MLAGIGSLRAQTTSVESEQTVTSEENLAKKLQNPIAALISVPFKSNFDFGLGPAHDGFRYTLEQRFGEETLGLTILIR